MKFLTTRNIAVCAMTAALYTALSLALAPISFYSMQIRASEALTLLCVFSPIAIWGVTLGCLLTNILGFMMGLNPLGFLDILLGTTATLLAAIATYSVGKIRTKKLPVLGAFPPVLFNAIILGAEFTILEVRWLEPRLFLFNFASIAVGQAIACFGLGLPLVYMLEKTGVAKLYSSGIRTKHRV